MTENLESAGLSGVSIGEPLPISIAALGSEAEEALSRRFGRPRKMREKLVFEFTRDPGLLHQYYNMYQRECRIIASDPKFMQAEEEYNRKSYIIIVRQGNLCIGGARLSIRNPRKTKPLPMEINGFSLAHFFPHLAEKEMCYGELSRLVLLPEFRDGDVTRHLILSMYRKALALNMDFVFAAAPLSNVRYYRKNAITMGHKQCKIHSEIIVPPYPGFEEVKDYLFSVELNKTLMQTQTISPFEETIGLNTEEV